VVDGKGKRLFHKRLPCELKQVEQALLPYGPRLHTIAVESTFNWYWLVDGLQGLGHRVVLANPAAVGQYEGLKHTDDKHDAFWMAEMLRLKILPTGHICHLVNRPVRDLLRRRLWLVRKRTALILSLKSLHARMHGRALGLGEIKRMSIDEVNQLFSNDCDQLLAREELRLIRELDVSIKRLEKQCLKRVRKMAEYPRLLSLPGVGQILGMTISLEVDDIRRFPSAGDFASYCRTVRSECSSNGKKKGENNTKCGNKYLAWAFVEAANFAQRFDLQAKAFYERKKAQVNGVLATKALACKLAKAAWYIMSQNVDYDPQRMFGGSSPLQPKGLTAPSAVSLTPKTAVENSQPRGKKTAGEVIASPAVESSDLADQRRSGGAPAKPTSIKATKSVAGRQTKARPGV